MRVTIQRHGYAGPWADIYPASQDEVGKNNAADFARGLQPDGVKAATAVAKWLKSKGYEPSMILSSPAVRTMQTAKIAQSILGGKLVSEPLLYPDGPLDVVVTRLADEGAKRVHLVVHADIIAKAIRYFKRIPETLKFAMAEARIYDVERDTYAMTERDGVRPGELGEKDYFDAAPGKMISNGGPLMRST